MLATEEYHETPQDIVVQVEDGDLSVTYNSQISRRSKMSRRKSANLKRDKYIHASNQPSIRQKLDKNDKTKVTDNDAQVVDDNNKETAKAGYDIYKDSAEANYSLDKKNVRDVETSFDSGKVDLTNKTEVPNELVKEEDEEKTNCSGNLDQTERHISGRSEDSETQDNLSMTARTENDVSEMPENELEETQNPERNAIEMDKTDNGSENLEQKGSCQLNHNDSMEEEIAEEIESYKSDNTENANKITFDNSIRENALRKKRKTGNIHDNSQGKENISKEKNSKAADENLSEAEKIQMCKAILSNYMKAARGEISSDEGSDVDIEEEIRGESEQTDILDEMLDDYIAEQEMNSEKSKGDRIVVTHRN